MKNINYDKSYYLKVSNNKKFVFVLGGVLSSLGKGIISSSIGALLESMGYNVSMQKIDPYYNANAGLLNPIEHGEVYVCHDGMEGDLDLGYYYRFTNADISSQSSITTGTIYKNIIDSELRGAFSGKTIQIIPHVTDVIKNKIIVCSEKRENTDIAVVEIGGTVGDIESQPFLEALRQFKQDNETVIILVTYVPTLEWSGEQKTKPSQHAIQAIRTYGIQPDLLLCRSSGDLQESSLDKLILYSSLSKKFVKSVPTAKSIYSVPYLFYKNGIMAALSEKLHLDKNIDITKWEGLYNNIEFINSSNREEINICFIGKYTYSKDCYRSLYEAVEHVSLKLGVRINIKALDVETVTWDTDLRCYDGVIIPGGFGKRGWHHLIIAAKLCWEQHIPCLGICFGFQAMLTSVLRHLCNMPGADSIEMQDDDARTEVSLACIVPWDKINKKIRLGIHPVYFVPSSYLAKIYNEVIINGIFRNRYILDPQYRETLAQAGVICVGSCEESQDGVEAFEMVDESSNTFFVGVQYHPELLSRPDTPDPIIKTLILFAVNKARMRMHT